MTPQLYTPAEVMARLKISRATLHRRITERRLTPKRVGNQRRFTETDIEQLIN